MNLTSLTSSDFARIAKLLKKKESLLERIAKVDRKLAAFEGGAVETAPIKKRTMSAAGRKAVAAAQRKRWAKIKAKKAGKGKRTMSAAARARISAARKAYWAKVKAEKAK